MRQPTDPPEPLRWFTIVAFDDNTQLDRLACQRRTETRIEMLAYELACYMPEVALELIRSGQKRMLAA
jgi:hypothetical protein